jgi:acyl-CoA synthetase (AMP-forming)/AMP-acid ligase II
VIDKIMSEAIPCRNWVELLRQRAIDESEQLAFGFMLSSVDEEICFTYAQLDEAARKIGAALQQAGLSGERAVLLYQPGPEYVCALMGCLYGGVVAVPVYAPRQNASYARVMQIIASARAAVLLSSDNIFATLDQEAWGELKQAGLRWLATDTLPPSLAEEWKMPGIDADTLAVLQYTSGSTGRPKGVQLCHRHLLLNSHMLARAMGCSRDSIGVIWIPPYHDMGLIGGLLQPMYSGFPVHLMSPATFLQRPIRWLEAISKYRGTISVAPNFAYEQCVKRIRPDQLAKLDLSSWQVAGNGAEPIRAHTLHEFSETFAQAGFDSRAFFPCYGMAEATLYVTGGPIFSGARILQASREALNNGEILALTEGDAIELVSSGTAAPEVQVRIVEPMSGRECKAGEVGEIWIAGDSIAAGYWEQPEATIDTFQARLSGSERNWLRTGDLGSLVDGELYVTGRLKDLIIIRGQNHYPHDIEATINGIHPALRAHGAAAFSIEHEDGEQLGLVLELERNALESDLLQIAALVRDAVSRQHQLQVDRLAFVLPGSIPKTSSGKIQRYLTRQRLLQGELPLIEEKQEAAACP